MDDRFLNELRKDPNPGFASRLRDRLRKQELPRTAWSARFAPSLAGALAVGLVVALFALPSVRVSAQAMLDLFRVRKFSAIPFDASRLDKLRALESNRTFMVFDRTEVVRDPGDPRLAPSIEAASAAAGFTVARPSYLPEGWTADTIRVEGPGEARLSVSEAKLRTLLDALDLRDVSVPDGLDNKVVEIRKSPVVIQQFRKGENRRATLLQSNSPEVGVPAGLDVARLAEIGLRILGLDSGEARRVATSTDWRSTLLIPVPLNASTFRQVTIGGSQGLLINMSGTNANGDRVSQGTMILWSEGDRVFAARGNLGDQDLLQMAESVQ